MSGSIEIVYDDGHLHNSVQVAGEFSEWQPVPMGLDAGTRYAAIFEGAVPGQNYQYKFIVDGDWRLLPTERVVVDASGFHNHVASATADQQRQQQEQFGASQGTHEGTQEGTLQGVSQGTQAAAAQERAIKPDQEEYAPAPSSVPGLAAGGVTGAALSSAAFSGGPGKSVSSYEYSEQQLENPIDAVGSTPRTKPDYQNRQLDEEDAIKPTGNFKVQGTEFTGKVSGGGQYEYTERQLDEPFGKQQQQDTSYEYTERQLDEPIDRLNYSQYEETANLPKQRPPQPPTDYELKSKDLDHPTERVEGLGKFTSEDIRSAANPQTLNNESDAMPGSLPFEKRYTDGVSPQQVEKSTLEAIGGGTNRPGGDSTLATAGGTTYDDTGEIDDSFRTVPLSAQSSGAYVDAYSSPQVRGTQGGFAADDSQNFGADLGSVGGDDSALLAAIGATNLRGSTGADALPSVGGGGDRTLARNLQRDLEQEEHSEYGTRSEDLDSVAARRAVEDTLVADSEVPQPLATTTAETVGTTTAEPVSTTDYHGSSAGSSSYGSNHQRSESSGANLSRSHSSPYRSPPSRKPHVPIDVSTGFPVDEEVEPQQHQQHQGTTRRQLSHTGVPIIGGGSNNTPTQTHENRNAAIAAAAARASAFAKQDVAAISNPPQQQNQHHQHHLFHTHNNANSYHQQQPREEQHGHRRPLSTQFYKQASPPPASTSQRPLSVGNHEPLTQKPATPQSQATGPYNDLTSPHVQQQQQQPVQQPQQTTRVGDRSDLQRAGSKKESRLSRFFKKLK